MFWKRDKVTRIAAPRGAVPRVTKTLIEQRGWKQDGNVYFGPYATRFGTWSGHIEVAGDQMRVLIRKPPAAIAKHPKWVCFHKHGGGDWYRIHLATVPVDRDPNAVIRYVEQILTESLAGS